MLHLAPALAGSTSLAYAVQVGGPYDYASASQTGSGTFAAGGSGTLSATVSVTDQLNLTTGGTIANGLASVSESVSDSQSLWATTTLTDTATTSITASDNLATTPTLTGTASATIATSGTDIAQGSWTLSTGGTIAAGVATDLLFVASSETDHETDTGNETDTDTESSRETGTVTGSGGASSNASLWEASTLSYGTAGAITGGVATYTLGNTLSTGTLPFADTLTDSSSQSETGTASFADQAGGTAGTAPFTRTTSASSSLSAYDVGYLTVGPGGTVASGGDVFTWALNNYQQSYFSASSTSLSVSESLLETFSRSETGTDTVGAGGTLAGGSDSFSWWQGGNNTYSLSQSAASTPHNWFIVYFQGLSNTWNDHGGDAFGPGGTTTAGNDGYLWSAYFQGSGSVSDSGVSTTATKYYLQGFNTATSSTYDAGNDTLSAGTLTGDDNYAFNETGPGYL